MSQLFSQAIRTTALRVSSNMRGSPLNANKGVSLESFSMVSNPMYTLSPFYENKLATRTSSLLPDFLTQPGGLPFATWNCFRKRPATVPALSYSTSTGGNNHNCINCHNCRNCNFCKDCDDCANCNGCAGCKNCSNCNNCVNCENCSNCNDCSGLKNASNESGVHN